MGNLCEHMRPMILEHADGVLPRTQSVQVERHLDCCASCRAFAQEMKTMARRIAALPRKQTSPGFDARLAARLAEARQDAEAKPAWRQALKNLISPSRPALRSSLALCGAAAALGGVLFFTPHAGVTRVAPPNAAIDDGALLAHCVEQHRSDSSAQPLDDWSAQNLSQQLDAAPPAALPSAVSLAEESNF